MEITSLFYIGLDNLPDYFVVGENSCVKIEESDNGTYLITKESETTRRQYRVFKPTFIKYKAEKK